MTDITLYMKQRLLIGKIEGYLHDLYGFGYKDRAEEKNTKPELVFQDDIRELLKDEYKVDNPCQILSTIGWKHKNKSKSILYGVSMA